MSKNDFAIAIKLTGDWCCKYCGSEKGKVFQAGPHRKLVCGACGKYLRFLNKASFSFLVQSDVTAAKVQSRLEEPLDEPLDVDRMSLDEINFKLDLILDHLNIKEEIK